MTRRLTMILLVALVLSSAASYLVYRLVGKQVATTSQSKTTPIVVATRDIELGSLIREADVKMGEWAGPVHPGMLTKPKDAIGRAAMSTLYQGEPVMEKRLAVVGSGGGLAATIPAGMRACAVRVNEVVGVAGFVTPGMRVDVLIAGNPQSGSGPAGAEVRTLLQNIAVLSAGSNFQKDNEGKPVQVPVVNLLVTPEQAEILSLASNETRIQLVLRNPTDTETVKTSGTAVARLFSESAPPVVRVRADRPRKATPPKPADITPAVMPAAPLPPKVHVVEVMNGSKRTEAKYSATEELQ